jgi:pyrophosphatase PpaX
LWDFDGTIVDTIAWIVAGHQQASATVLGQPWDEAEIRRWIGRPLDETVRRAEPERADAILEVYQRWSQAHTEQQADCYPGLPEVLRDLAAAGVCGGLVTSRRRCSTLEICHRLGLAETVPLLVAGDDLERHKPDPAPLWLALERLGATPDRAAYIGDALVDVASARAAGLTAVAVAWGAGDETELRAAAPDHLVADVAALRALLGLPPAAGPATG